MSVDLPNRRFRKFACTRSPPSRRSAKTQSTGGVQIKRLMPTKSSTWIHVKGPKYGVGGNPLPGFVLFFVTRFSLMPHRQNRDVFAIETIQGGIAAIAEVD